MGRFLLILSIFLFFMAPISSWANPSQYPNPYRQTAWNNFTDTLHTIGQSPGQANITKKRLHQARANARLHSIYLARKAKMASWQQSQNQ